jgi:uncharacterized protein (DUF2267 family)
MRHDDFLDKVCERADLSCRAEAATAVRATLATLGGCVPGGLADIVAALLPRAVGDHLRAEPTPPCTGREQFVARVADRTGTDPASAAALAAVVLQVVGDATEGAALALVREALPPDLSSLCAADE